MPPEPEKPRPERAGTERAGTERAGTERARTERAGTEQPAPFAVYAKSANGFRIAAIDRHAGPNCGLSSGMSVADARAIRPDLVLFEADEAADRAVLAGLAAWCERFSPFVALDGRDGLFLDLTGVAHLFGGEGALRRDLLSRLNARGFKARAAIAPCPGAAWALARFGDEEALQHDIRNPDAFPDPAMILAPLPVAALRLAPAPAALLRRLGLTRIGQIFNAPRAPLAARAGQAALHRLDQAMGRVPEPLTPFRPPPPCFALRRYADPLMTTGALFHAIDGLCADLATDLAARNAGAMRLELTLFPPDHPGHPGRTRRVSLRLARPEYRASAMMRLLGEYIRARADEFSTETGFETLRLDAIPDRREMRQMALGTGESSPDTRGIARINSGPDSGAGAAGFIGFTGDPDGAEAAGDLVNLLTARLGAGRVGRLSVCAVHAPERVNHWAPETGRNSAPGAPSIAPPADGVMRRPLTLFPRPLPIEVMAALPDGPPAHFRWRRVLYRIARAEGPERITPFWLRAPDSRTRDYYRIEDKEGRRFWVFREGRYDAPASGPGTTAPKWFVHGLFA